MPAAWQTSAGGAGVSRSLPGGSVLSTPQAVLSWSVIRGQQRLVRKDRHHCRAVQAPRVRLRLRRDLRRHPLGLGLRAAGRGAQGEHQAAVVEGDGHRSRGRRRPRQLGDPAAPGLGGVRPRRRVQRPARRVHALPQALPGRHPRRGVRRAHRQDGERRRSVGRPVPELRHPRPVHRAARLQHDAQDLPRPGGVRGGPALPASGDRAGHLRELPERADDRAAQAPVRHRPDGQELPQRDHARQLHLPHARVRADGDGVLRRAGHGRGTAPVLDRRAHALVRRPGHRRRETSGTTSTRRRSCRTTRSAPSTSSTASASPARNGASSRASRTAPIST